MSSESKSVLVESLHGLGQETTTDTFPHTDSVPVDGEPFTSPEDRIAPTRVSGVDVQISASVSAATAGFEHLPLDIDNNFTVSLDEPLFGRYNT